MDQYVYLLLSAPFAILSAIIFILRPDLRRHMVKFGLVGAIIGLIVELWYFQDYWQPLSLFGKAVFSLEDALAGFFIVAFSSSIYDFLTGTIDRRKTTPGTRKAVLATAAGGILLMLLLVNVLGVNSLLVTTLLSVAVTAYILIRRPVLWKRAVVTAVLTLAVGVIDYFILFHLIAPDYLAHYFLLTNKPFNPTLLGFMPLFEVFWYTSWGLFAGTLFVYLTKEPTIT